MLKANIIVETDIPKRSKKIIKEALQAAYKTTKPRRKAVLNVILTDEESIRKLNAQYREIDKPTDVLSFVNDEDPVELGDVFISVPRAIEQALSYGHSYDRELAFLTVHGYLHCLGYDHLEKSDEEKMFGLQDDILKQTKYTR